jgi:hypothetical protein
MRRPRSGFLRLRRSKIGMVGGLNATATQLASKSSTAIGFVSHQLLRSRFGTPAFARHGDRLQSGISQCDFVRLGAVHMQADGQTVPLEHGLDPRPFADFGLAYSSQPSASSWPRKTRQMHTHVPSRDHSFKSLMEERIQMRMIFLHGRAGSPRR